MGCNAHQQLFCEGKLGYGPSALVPRLRISRFLGTEDTILYSSCFDANTGLFETLLGREDAVISDELNHASIIDGIRLCRADRKRYLHGDMADLETRLQETADARFRMIATEVGKKFGHFEYATNS